MDIYVKCLLFPYLLFFWWGVKLYSITLFFKNDFIRCVDFTRIAASNTASDDVTKLGHT